jgi:hypothetical protein
VEQFSFFALASRTTDGVEAVFIKKIFAETTSHSK